MVVSCPPFGQHLAVSTNNQILEETKMLSEAMQTALNDQIQKELHSAYIYLSMSAYFESQNLAGAASWMRHQAEEEQDHGMKIFELNTCLTQGQFHHGHNVLLVITAREFGHYTAILGVHLLVGRNIRKHLLMIQNGTRSIVATALYC